MIPHSVAVSSLLVVNEWTLAEKITYCAFNTKALLGYISMLTQFHHCYCVILFFIISGEGWWQGFDSGKPLYPNVSSAVQPWAHHGSVVSARKIRTGQSYLHHSYAEGKTTDGFWLLKALKTHNVGDACFRCCGWMKTPSLPPLCLQYLEKDTSNPKCLQEPQKWPPLRNALSTLVQTAVLHLRWACRDVQSILKTKAGLTLSVGAFTISILIQLKV